MDTMAYIRPDIYTLVRLPPPLAYHWACRAAGRACRSPLQAGASGGLLQLRLLRPRLLPPAALRLLCREPPPDGRPAPPPRRRRR